jgi:ABC-type sugar transport system permease subunit
MAADLQEGGAANGISLGLGVGSWQQYLPFAWSNGGQVVDEATTFTLDDPANVEALEYYASFFDEGLTSAQPEGFDITPAFVQGSFPMFFSGPWHLALIEETGGEEFEDKWTVAPMPSEGLGDLLRRRQQPRRLPESDNRDAAWAFVEFVSRPDVQSLWYQEVGALPAVQESWESGELADDEHLSMFGEQLQDTQAPPPIPTWEEVAAAIDDQIERAAVGGVPPRTPRRRCSPTRSPSGPGWSDGGHCRRPRAARVAPPPPSAQARAQASRQQPRRLGVLAAVVRAVPGLPGRPDPRLAAAELHRASGSVTCGTRSGRASSGSTTSPWPRIRSSTRSTLNTLYFVVAGVPLTLGFGLGAALLLNSALIRFKTFFRMGFYLPVVTSIVAIAVIWRYLLHPDLGLVNNLLGGGRHRRTQLAGRPGPGDARDHRDGGVAQRRVRDGDLPRRPAGDPRRPLRGGPDRRCQPVAGVPLHHAADAAADAAVRVGDHRHRLPPTVRGAVRDDRWWAARPDPVGHDVRLPAGFNFLNLGYASAIAYALFVAIVVLTVVNFRLLRPQT